MKKIYALSFAAIMVVAIFVSVRIFVGNEMEFRESVSDERLQFGKTLMEMEDETNLEVKEIIENLTYENKAELEELLTNKEISVMERLPDLESEDVRIQVMKDCALIRALAGEENDYEKMPEKEKKLKKTELVKFASSVFSYCLDVNDNCNEKADYNAMKKYGRDLKENLNPEVEGFVNLLMEVRT